MGETKNNAPTAVEKIKARLTQVRKSEADMHELALLLERESGNHVDVVRLNRLALGNRANDSVKLEELYQTFYSAYVIRLLEKYVDIIRDRLLLFAVYGILPGYKNLNVGERREKYAEDNPNVKFERARTTVSGWSDPNSRLPDFEDKIIKALAKQLDTETDGLKKKLGLSTAVFDELEKKFPNGLPEELPSDFPECIALNLEDNKNTVEATVVSENDKAIVEPLNIPADNKNCNKPASVVDDDTSEGINPEEDHPSDNPENDEASAEPLGGLDADKTTNEPTTDPDDKSSGAHPLCVFIKKHPFLFVIVVLLVLALIVFFIYNICGSAQRDTHDISSEPESITEEPEDISEIDDSESPINERISPDWGDSIGGRTSYTAGQLERNILANQVVFNSKGQENDPGGCKAIYPGDEKNFVKVWLQNTGSDNNDLWESENITVENGKSYMIRIDINNDNPKKHIVAKDTKVALSIPSYSDTKIPVRGYIESSNAEPSKIWDGVVFSSAEDKSFHLRFRPNTATLYNKFTGEANGMELSDDIVLKATDGGTLIGYNELNGEIPGGPQYGGRVEAWVDVIYDKYSVATQVRKLGATEWGKSVDAEIGDQVEFQIEYNNTSTETQTNVMIRDILPGNLKYVAGTTKLYNYSTKGQWATLTPDGDIVTRGVNIRSYLGSPDGEGGGNAFVRFTAEVVDTDLAYGENFIYNWGQVTVDNDLIENPSVVIVQKPEQ